MFLPKYGIKNYHLLPSRYNLNEIPSFYFYNKIKLNKSMYSRFVQVFFFFYKQNFFFLFNISILYFILFHFIFTR